MFRADFLGDRVALLCTVDVCDGPPCATDHRHAGRVLLADLRKLLAQTAVKYVIRQSRGWRMPPGECGNLGAGVN